MQDVGGAQGGSGGWVWPAGWLPRDAAPDVSQQADPSPELVGLEDGAGVSAETVGVSGVTPTGGVGDTSPGGSESLPAGGRIVGFLADSRMYAPEDVTIVRTAAGPDMEPLGDVVLRDLNTSLLWQPSEEDDGEGERLWHSQNAGGSGNEATWRQLCARWGGPPIVYRRDVFGGPVGPVRNAEDSALTALTDGREPAGSPIDAAAVVIGEWLAVATRAGYTVPAFNRLWLEDLAEQMARAKPARIETSMQVAVRGDLEVLAGTLKGGARASLAAMALWLSEVIDKRGGDAGPTTSARLAQELRATLVALTTEKNDDGDAFQRLLDVVSTPVRDTADAGSSDVGSEGGGDRPVDGQAADAAPAVHGRRRAGD
jgi:hypothetical protein